uniref:3-oxoacyl-[acyl-carrier-protein] reductase n=1 Tax=Gossypium raimondii TaxID=29730 RepID=A0A0D2U5Z3_GOSRA|nr:hypothetical protein B456_010G117600 [Gossypium raimondii]
MIMVCETLDDIKMHLSDTEYDPYLQNVNNVGTINKKNRIWEVPVEEYDIVIDVNVKGIANVLCHFISLMLPKSRGVIVNMSSGWGRPDAALVNS